MNSKSLNQNLLLGYQYYRSHEYSQSLKFYTIALRQENNSSTKSIIQLAIATIYIQLCEYQQAYTLLHSIIEKNNCKNLQSCVVMLKAHCYLCLINIINAESQTAQQHINICVQLISKYSDQSRSLLTFVIQILYGFDSFHEMQTVANSFAIQQSLFGNGIICSAMSFNRQICGINLELAYKLQHKAYEIFKDKKQTIFTAISCRHLLHLSKLLKLSKNVIMMYEKQLNFLMQQTPQLQGVSENTLFRDYQAKIQCATNVTKQLLFFQNNLRNTKPNQKVYNQQKQQLWKKKAIIFKLNQIKNQSNKQNCENINRVMRIVTENSQNLIYVMQSLSKSQFLHSALQSYKNGVISFSSILSKFYLRRCWGLLQIRKIGQRELQIQSYNAQQMYAQKKQQRKFRKTQLPPQSKNVSKSPLRKDKSFQKLNNKKESIIKSTNAEKYQLQKQQIKPSKLDNSQNQSLNNMVMNPILSILKKNQNRQHETHKRLEQKQKVIFEEGFQSNRQSSTTVKKKQQQMIRRLEELQKFQKQKLKEKQKMTNYSSSKMQIKNNSNNNNNMIIQRQQLLPEKQFNITIVNKSQQPLVIERQYNSPQKSKLPQSKISNKLNQGKFKPKQSKLASTASKILNITKLIHLCKNGQYAIKRHFSSDGGQQKFFQLTDTHFRWSLLADGISSSSAKSYLLSDIQNIFYGKSSDTFKKQCNKKLQPWRCFSLVLKKRTLDIYCPQERDIHFWVPGLSYSLQKQKSMSNINPYPIGKVLWMKCFMKILFYHSNSVKKSKRNQPIRPELQLQDAIINFGKSFNRSKLTI